MDRLNEEIPEVASRTFLLTSLRDGRVKAERIRDARDARLRSKEPFASITVDSFLLTDGEMKILEGFKAEPGRLVDSVGGAQIMRPGVAERIGGIHPFFHALRDATDDTFLEVEDFGPTGVEWRISRSPRGA